MVLTQIGSIPTTLTININKVNLDVGDILGAVFVNSNITDEIRYSYAQLSIGQVFIFTTNSTIRVLAGACTIGGVVVGGGGGGTTSLPSGWGGQGAVVECKMCLEGITQIRSVIGIGGNTETLQRSRLELLDANNNVINFVIAGGGGVGSVGSSGGPSGYLSQRGSGGSMPSNNLASGGNGGAGSSSGWGGDGFGTNNGNNAVLNGSVGDSLSPNNVGAQAAGDINGGGSGGVVIDGTITTSGLRGAGYGAGGSRQLAGSNGLIYFRFL